MMKTEFRFNVKQAIIAASLCAFTPSTVLSDTYTWGSITGPTSNPATCGTSPDASEVVFTMIQGDGAININTSSTFNFGEHTITCGTFTFDTVTNTGTAEIVGFGFAGFTAEAKSITLDLIPSGLAQGNATFMLANMSFDWNGNNGIPVSIVYDAQGILGEMDGAAASFTLADDGSGTANSDPTSTVSITSALFADTGAAPASDGTSAFGGLVLLAQGPKPVAGTIFDTPKVTGTDGNGDAVCVSGADDEYSPIPNTSGSRLNEGGGCMAVVPSADIALAIITDAFDNSGNNPTNTIGKSGDPMIDGPFGSFNANFSFDDMKLVGFDDTTAPTQSLNAHITPAGTTPLQLSEGVDTYSEPGATCTDAAPLGTDLSASVVVGGDTVNTAVAATYVVTYDCTDASGNAATQITRSVVVLGAGPPAVVLLGNATETAECGVAYMDAGATCVDAEDGTIPEGANFVRDQSVIDAGINVVGLYTDSVSWTCQDITNPNPPVTELRSVDVTDTIAPVIILNGNITDDVVSSTAENTVAYIDAGADATDGCDAVGFPLTINTATSGAVDMIVPDSGPDTLSYALQYTAADASTNSDTALRTVNVQRSQPVITLVGSNAVLNVGDAYTEEGMDITDAQQGGQAGITASGSASGLTYVIDSSGVDTSVSGEYSVTYDVTDITNNAATQVTRLVTVGVFASGSNFTMLNAPGTVFGGTNDVVFDWDQSVNTDVSGVNFNMSIASQGPFAFFGFIWVAHDVRVFGPGTYSFDTGCTVAEIKATGCPAGSAALSGPAMTMTVPAGHVGGHILFDWNGSLNIDVVNVWEIDGVWDQHGDANPKNELYKGNAGDAPDPTTTWKLVSTDVNGDGINASPMVDGPFQGFYANFNAGPGGTAEPTPPITSEVDDTDLGSSALASLTLWSLFAGLVSLIGFRRFQKQLR